MELYQAPRHRRAMRVRRLGALRPAMVVAILAALVWLALASFGPAPAAGAEYDAAKAAQREEFIRTAARVQTCMFDGSKAVFHRGVIERVTVTTFTMGSCGQPLVQMLQRDGYTQAEAITILRRVSDRAYDDAISWGR